MTFESPLVGTFGALAADIAGFGAMLAARLPGLVVVTTLLLFAATVANWLLGKRVAASLRVYLFLVVFARVALPGDAANPLGLFGVSARAAGSELGEITLAPATTASASVAGFTLTSAFALGALYFLVAGALFAHWIAARWRLDRDLRGSVPVAHALPGARPMRLYQHPHLGPLIAGLWRPRLVLPADLLQKGDAQTLGFILAHEGAHLARRDHLVLAAVQLGCIIAWPVLPLWVAARQIRGLVELACDETALAGRSGAERRRYGEILIALSAGEPALAASPLVPSFGWHLRERVRALKWVRRWRRAAQVVATGLVGLGLLACSGAPDGSAAGAAEPAAAPAAEKAAEPGALHTPNVVILSLDRQGQLWLNQRQVAREMLEEELRQALAAANTQTLLLRVAPALNNQNSSEGFQYLFAGKFNLMAVAKRAGATTINIMAPREEKDPTKMYGRKGPLLPPEGAAPPPAPAAAPATPAPKRQPQPALRARDKGLDAKLVSATIRAHMNEVKACYESGLAAGEVPTSLRITTDFVINVEGKVESASIGGPGKHDALDDCLLKNIRAWTFPKPLTSTQVSFPFLLEGSL